MALGLINAQTNDARLLYLTDNSTWGSDGVPALGSVTSAVLQISYRDTTLDNFTTPIEIDVLSIFTAANGDTSLLVFPIEFNSAPSLDDDGVGINALPDGIWKIQYIINGTIEFPSTLELLLDMNIKTVIYRNLSTVPVKYLCANNYYTKPIDDILLEKSLHYAMEANAYVAKQSEILNILDTLERLTQ